VGDARILAEDEAAFLAEPKPTAPARLLPSGDAYYLLWGADREILVPQGQATDRVVDDARMGWCASREREIAGVWRRSAAEISIAP
jgi:hypothetical protein